MLSARDERPMLRVVTCGSVDDGKSTLIGRLLYDADLIREDELEALAIESRAHGTVPGGLDLSLLLDGLQAEREQKITIDVAYRYFATGRRKFIVADAPGHGQYTRNMATGASVSDLALVLVDVRKGVTAQTRRHTIICKLLGIRHVVLVANKMDLVGFDRLRFEAVEQSFRSYAAMVGIAHVHCVPVSALHGDNIVASSPQTPWFAGPALLPHLEEIDVSDRGNGQGFRLPVQWVCRPHLDFRGYAGTVRQGTLVAGATALVLPSRRTTRITRIVTADGDLELAEPGTAVVVTLADELDVSRGDILAAMESPPDVADQVAAHIISFSDAPLLPGRPYQVLCGPQTLSCNITSIKHRINVDNLDRLSARSLALNEIGYCNLAFSRPLVFDPYETSRETGSFVLVDNVTRDTVAAGMIEFGLRRAENLRWQDFDIDRRRRAEIKHQSPFCLWFTGLSASGKSTLANLLEKRLVALGRHTYVLDGDNIRHGLNADLGFTDADRVENIRRVAQVSRLMVDAGLIVMVSFISPFRAERRMARDLFAQGEFVEVFIDTPLALCEARDPKGFYKKARAGQLKNFTGIDSAYEPPEHAEIRLDGSAPPEALVQQMIDELTRRALM